MTASSHLDKRGTESPFLVDRKGKPKDNTSVSVYPTNLGRQGLPDLLPGSAAESLFLRFEVVCRPFIDPDSHTSEISSTA